MKKLNKKKNEGLRSGVFYDKLSSLFRLFVYILPGVLFFSYYPLMHFGANESMNFELSLPIIWLILFDVLGFLLILRRKRFFCGFKKWWAWLLFPIYLTISVLWSLNSVRGVLVAGVMWLICFAIYIIYSLRNLFSEKDWGKFWKWFLWSALLACGWCFVQCVLDLMGTPQDYTLLCDGCTYRMFGFPHPNGFAIEPQFMGNLLLAPAIISIWMYVKKIKNNSGSGFLCSGFLLVCFFIFTATLFLTFSRGAIYAFIVAMIFMTAYLLAGEKKIAKRILTVWGLIVGAFLLTLNIQGIMAQVSPTNDTYRSGVAKVINHLSLGVIDIRGEEMRGEADEGSGEMDIIRLDTTREGAEDGGIDVVENYVENSRDEKGESVFDGYVVESTETRLRLSSAAIEVWRQNFATILFGTGLGGAGQALYNDGLSPAPKEIIQNQYVSLLLETGLVGVSLLLLVLVMAIRLMWKIKGRIIILSLMVAYGISLCFFSGLPNALHIYLLLVLLTVFLDKRSLKEGN